MRLLCSEARVDSQRLRPGYVTKKDAAKMLVSAGSFVDAPLFIDDIPGLTITDLRARATRLKSEEGAGTDLGLPPAHARQERQQPRAGNSGDFARAEALAKGLDIPVIALSQFNRKVEERADKRPMLSDLRESGAIEQDADSWPSSTVRKSTGRTPPRPGSPKIIIGKQRNGPIGMAKLAYIKNYTKFENLA